MLLRRIAKENAAPVGSPWMWMLAFGHHQDRTPTHGSRRRAKLDGCIRQELVAGMS
jgi:hypothetical protein